MTEAKQETKQNYFVVRNRNGKFQRAFLTEAQAQRWIEGEKGWTYQIEQEHEKDENGNVFDLVRKVGA